MRKLLVSDDMTANVLHVVVTAHPDDESMFFVPLIWNLVAEGKKVWVLCLTTGNFDGLGEVRREELCDACYRVLGVHNVLSLDDLEDHPTKSWSIEKAGSIIKSSLMRELKESKEDFGKLSMYTFDKGGVSGHVNHRDTFFAVRHLVQEENAKEMSGFPITSAWALRTEQSLLAKYVPLRSWFHLLVSVLGLSESTGVQTFGDGQKLYRHFLPSINWAAMVAHRSQFVWYRRLFVVFSCYTYENRLQPLSLND